MTQSVDPQHGGARRRRARRILSVLLALDLLLLGAFGALLFVNRHLESQLTIYSAMQVHMDEASTILDLLDDLLPSMMIVAGGLVLSLLLTIGVRAWLMPAPAIWRWGSLALALLVVLLLILLFDAPLLSSGPSSAPPMMTPTP